MLERGTALAHKALAPRRYPGRGKDIRVPKRTRRAYVLRNWKRPSKHRVNYANWKNEQIKFYAKDKDGVWGWVLLPRYMVERMQRKVIQEQEHYTFEGVLEIRERWYQSKYPTY